MTAEVLQPPLPLEVGLPELALLCERATSDLPAPLQPVHDAALRVRELAHALSRSEIDPLPDRPVAEILAGMEESVPEAQPPLDATADIVFTPFDLEADEAAPLGTNEPEDDAATSDEAYMDSMHQLEQALTVESDTHVVHAQLVALRRQAQAHPPHFGPVQRPIVALALARLAHEDPYAAEVLASASAGTRAELVQARRRVTGTIGAVLVATRALRLL